MNPPKISIISPSFNTGKFLEATIQSILAQSYKNFEHIVVDGGSTDDTIEILKKYPHIKWISEKDSGYWEAFDKGLKMADGDYILQCSISDGYLDNDWFKKCLEVMEKDKEVSLIWGLQQNIDEDGKLLDVAFKQFHHRDPPQKAEYFYHWLRTFEYWQEGNMFLRANVWRNCFPKFDMQKNDEIDPIFSLRFQFIEQGYLPYFVRSIASFARIHKNQMGERESITGIRRKKLDTHLNEMKEYRRAVLFHGERYVWRDGSGSELPGHFSRTKFVVDYVLTPRSLVRGTLSGAAALVRKPANAIARSAYTPDWIVESIQKLKFFYERGK